MEQTINVSRVSVVEGIDPTIVRFVQPDRKKLDVLRAV